jgi:hypothetical protein
MKYPNKERGERILAWLKDHPLLSISALCTKVGYDQRNLDKAFSGARAIPAKYLDAFEEELGRYGYIPKSE